MTIDFRKIIGEKRFGKVKSKNFIKFTKCRFCNSGKLIKVIDLGLMPLAGGFIKKKTDFKKEKKYPLDLFFCKNCYLLQTGISINPDILFKEYFYFSSSIKTLVDHFNKTAQKISNDLREGSSIVEIGCNDGEFIKALQKSKFKACGVDPATNIVKPLIKKGMPIINSYFNQSVAKKISKKYGKADAIYSFHSLAHIPDMHEVVKGIKILLKPEGYLAFEVHYLGNLLEGLQYDMIYHEHLHYYSLITLKKFFGQYNMEIYDIERNNLRSGSITYFVQDINTGKKKMSRRVKSLEKNELKEKLNTPIPYLKFYKKIKNTKKDLLHLLNKLNKDNKTITGYGASGRGTVILNYCGLDAKLLKFVVDDAPAKHGCFMPGTHNPIFSSQELVNQNSDYSVVFAWPFIEEVKKRNKTFMKNGGKFILPVTKVKVI